MEKLGVTVGLTWGYNTKPNSQVKWLNQEIGWYVRTYCYNNQEDWVKVLPWMEYLQNSLVHSATNITPFKCVPGNQPPLLPGNATETEVIAVDELFWCSTQVWEDAHRYFSHATQVCKTSAQHCYLPVTIAVKGTRRFKQGTLDHTKELNK